MDIHEKSQTRHYTSGFAAGSSRSLRKLSCCADFLADTNPLLPKS